MNELTFSQRLVARILMACLLLFIVVSIVLQHIANWLNGRSTVDWSRTLNLPEFNVVKIRNPCVLTRLTRSQNDISGYPLQLEASVQSDTSCYILFDIDVEEFHRALLAKTTSLIQFFRARSSEAVELKIGKRTMDIEQFAHQLQPSQWGLKRTTYPIVIGFVSDSCGHSKEQIVVCCYVIHVRLHPMENIDTGVMYTFWKTNWNRLLTPQAIYASRDNSTNTTPGIDLEPIDVSPNWIPSCFICLCEIKEDLRVLLPCRHAGLCFDCFREFGKWMTVGPRYPLSDLVCPLCRTSVTAVMKIACNRTEERPVDLEDVQ